MRTLKRFFLRQWYRILGIGPADMPMVSYWKRKEYVEAKMTTEDGATKLVMEGEKYPIWGFPRGHLLVPAHEEYGPLARMKHGFKQMFNEVWRKLDEGVPKERIVEEGLVDLDKALAILDELKYDLMPPSAMCPAVREIHRAMTKVCDSERSLRVRDALCLVLQEDDAFRYRVQWMADWMPLITLSPVRFLDYGLKMVELGEVVGDMKRRIRLLRRGVSVALEDNRIRGLFLAFFRECKWRKVRITEAEKYHFRAKYFKVDLGVLEY